MPPQPAAPRPRACDGRSGAASRDPRATGARRCLPWWGCGCTICRSRPSASKNKKRPAAGGGWGGRLPPRMPAGLGGWCPTAPRSKQHARGAGRCRHFRGAHPRATARPLLRRTRIRARKAVRPLDSPSCDQPRAPRAGSGRPVAFPGRPPPRFRGRVSFVFGLLFSLDMTSLDELGAEHRARTTVRVVVALKSSGSSVAFAGDRPDRPFLILSSQDNSTLNRLS